MKLNPPPRALALAFAGGSLGTLLRGAISLALGNLLALFVVNLAGSYFLGWVNGSAQGPRKRFASPEAKWFWGAGFSGGFTTMSGLALMWVLMLANLGVIAGLLYVLSQLVAGLLCYALGYRAGKGAWPSVD
ncbi:MAG: hypothetical protein RL454_1093 [Actinomycetota bacterium]